MLYSIIRTDVRYIIARRYKVWLKKKISLKLCQNLSLQADQPQAIEQLTNGFQSGEKFQTLLGVTGSGKTFTMANVIQNLNKPTPCYCS